MQVEKLRKTCGYILYIKSIIALVVTIILIFGGITMAIMGKHMVDNPGQGDNTGFEGAVGSCSTAFVGVLGIVFGIVSIVVGCLLILDAIFSMIHSRKILRNDSDIDKSIKVCIATETVSVIVGIFITVAGIANIKEAVGIILLVVAVILIAQSIATIVLLSKLKKLNSVN